MSCADLLLLLRDPFAPLPPEAEAHVTGCLSCQALRASFARVDALLASEPAPPAPPDLTARVLRAIRTEGARRAHDVAWARRQALLLVAAAALVAGLGLTLGGAPLDAVTSGVRLEAAGLLAEVSRTLEALVAQGARTVAGALPSPPVVVILLLLPALLALNGWLCAPARRSA